MEPVQSSGLPLRALAALQPVPVHHAYPQTSLLETLWRGLLLTSWLGLAQKWKWQSTSRSHSPLELLDCVACITKLCLSVHYEELGANLTGAVVQCELDRRMSSLRDRFMRH